MQKYAFLNVQKKLFYRLWREMLSKQYEQIIDKYHELNVVI